MAKPFPFSNDFKPTQHLRQIAKSVGTAYMLSCKSTTPWRNTGQRTNISNSLLVGRSVDEGPEKLDLMSIQINCEEHVVRRHHGFLNSCRKEARKLGKCLTAEYLDLKTLTQSQHFTPELTKTLWPCGQHNTLQPYHAPPRHPGSRPRVFVWKSSP